ncbi:hypothetical protein BGZ99_001083 [Dissophora globulifera]|uniref:Uncharacterized protein n=1 Tax=Dissophora globulifera TaxID=979702 RepID=A0A9P6R3C0_9FUNG|nr:hypothetical protein BGZ99_001083 [Dissophora globulifera]
MYIDDGSWASKLAIRDKAQATVLDFIAAIKVARADAELSESLSETGKQFATLETTMKSTRQVQEVNFGVLDNLRATDQASESLRIEPVATRE